MSEIKVVPCDERWLMGDNKFHLQVNGKDVPLADKGRVCGTEAEALEKSAELLKAEGLSVSTTGLESDTLNSNENSEPIEQAAPPRPLELCRICNQPTYTHNGFCHHLPPDHAAAPEREPQRSEVKPNEAQSQKSAAIEQVRPQPPELRYRKALELIAGCSDNVRDIEIAVDALHPELQAESAAAEPAPEPSRDTLWMSVLCDCCENGERRYQIGDHWYHNANDCDVRCLGMDALMTVNKWAAEASSLGAKEE